MSVEQIRQPETVEVANFLIERLGKSMVTAELMHPDELVSGILSQVAAQPEMAQLLSGFIYTTEGEFLSAGSHHHGNTRAKAGMD